MLVVTGNRTNSWLAPFSFPKKQNSSSPLSTSNFDSEPISKNLDHSEATKAINKKYNEAKV